MKSGELTKLHRPVQPLDAWTYVGVAVMLPVMGLIAALIPARRAASIEPMEALRTE